MTLHAAEPFCCISKSFFQLQSIEKIHVDVTFFSFLLRVLKSNRLGHFMCTATEAIIDNKCGLLVEYCVLI